MNKYEKLNYRKARKLINWSFIGILIPILGIPLAAIGKSILKDLPGQESEIITDRIEQLNGRGSIGLFLSCLFLISGVALGVWSVQYNKHTVSANEKIIKDSSWQVGYDKGHDAGLAEVGPRIDDDETKLVATRTLYNDLVGELKATIPGQSTALHCIGSGYDSTGNFQAVACN